TYAPPLEFQIEWHAQRARRRAEQVFDDQMLARRLQAQEEQGMMLESIRTAHERQSPSTATPHPVIPPVIPAEDGYSSDGTPSPSSQPLSLTPPGPPILTLGPIPIPRPRRTSATWASGAHLSAGRRLDRNGAYTPDLPSSHLSRDRPSPVERRRDRNGAYTPDLPGDRVLPPVIPPAPQERRRDRNGAYTPDLPGDRVLPPVVPPAPQERRRDRNGAYTPDLPGDRVLPPVIPPIPQERRRDRNGAYTPDLPGDRPIPPVIPPAPQERRRDRNGAYTPDLPGDRVIPPVIPPPPERRYERNGNDFPSRSRYPQTTTPVIPPVIPSPPPPSPLDRAGSYTPDPYRAAPRSGGSGRSMTPAPRHTYERWYPPGVGPQHQRPQYGAATPTRPAAQGQQQQQQRPFIPPVIPPLVPPQEPAPVIPPVIPASAIPSHDPAPVLPAPPIPPPARPVKYFVPPAPRRDPNFFIDLSAPAKSKDEPIIPFIPPLPIESSKSSGSSTTSPRPILKPKPASAVLPQKSSMKSSFEMDDRTAANTKANSTTSIPLHRRRSSLREQVVLKSDSENDNEEVSKGKGDSSPLGIVNDLSDVDSDMEGSENIPGPLRDLRSHVRLFTEPFKCTSCSGTIKIVSILYSLILLFLDVSFHLLRSPVTPLFLHCHKFTILALDFSSS
ncbi:hypothetical protein H0H87_000913, partial [Tephrocybe sp. NHM501043]